MLLYAKIGRYDRIEPSTTCQCALAASASATACHTHGRGCSLDAKFARLTLFNNGQSLKAKPTTMTAAVAVLAPSLLRASIALHGVMAPVWQRMREGGRRTGGRAAGGGGPRARGG